MTDAEGQGNSSQRKPWMAMLNGSQMPYSKRDMTSRSVSRDVKFRSELSDDEDEHKVKQLTNRRAKSRDGIELIHNKPKTQVHIVSNSQGLVSGTGNNSTGKSDSYEKKLDKYEINIKDADIKAYEKVLDYTKFKKDKDALEQQPKEKPKPKKAKPKPIEKEPEKIEKKP